jgi:hypothetical protein
LLTGFNWLGIGSDCRLWEQVAVLMIISLKECFVGHSPLAGIYLTYAEFQKLDLLLSYVNVGKDRIQFVLLEGASLDHLTIQPSKLALLNPLKTEFIQNNV